MNHGKVEEPNSSRNRFRSTERSAAISAILMATSSRWDRAPISPTVSVSPGGTPVHRERVYVGGLYVRPCTLETGFISARPFCCRKCDLDSSRVSRYSGNRQND